MQLKPLIIVIVVAMVLLLGFNVINGNRHENNRAEMTNAATAVDTQASSTANGADMNSASSTTDITSKPLGEQPKAIMDKATTQIDDAQQADNARLAQLDSAQQ